jgi:hypothetical protein
MALHTKDDIAKARKVHQRTVDNWRARGLLPEPIKLGTAQQSRVRWTDEAVAALDRNLAALSAEPPAAA